MSRRLRLQPIVRYVYVIGPACGLQKIGMAINPQERLAALQTASPVELLIHAAIAVPFGAAPDVEHQAHRLLGRMCVRNEWFEATPAEALFAVYTAALPWMAKLPTLRRSEPESARAPLAPLPLTAAQVPLRWRDQDTSPMDPLPLFRSWA